MKWNEKMHKLSTLISDTLYYVESRTSSIESILFDDIAKIAVILIWIKKKTPTNQLYVSD